MRQMVSLSRRLIRDIGLCARRPLQAAPPRPLQLCVSMTEVLAVNIHFFLCTPVLVFAA